MPDSGNTNKECKACDTGDYSSDGKTCYNCNCIEGDTCDSITGECKKSCKTGFYKDTDNTKLCLNCPSLCSDCISFDKCVKCNNGLDHMNGRCLTCMQKYHGCDEECNKEEGCKKCLDFFKNSDGSCNTTKPIPLPSFELLGFGHFNKKNSKKITFIIYLRIKVGMMYNARVTFNIFIITSGRRRILQQTGSGTGIQNRIAQGSYSEHSYMSDFLVKFDCEGNVEDSSVDLQIDNLTLTERNEKETFIPIQLSSSLKKPISNFDSDAGKDIEDKFGLNKVLHQFIQKTNSERRRLSSDSVKCILSGNTGIISIDGTVVENAPIKNKNFTLKTTDNDEAKCTLNKAINSYDANLECIIQNPKRGFNLDESNFPDTDGSGEYMSFTIHNTDESSNPNSNALCETYESGDRESNESSSSGGLSGGAIAGIVIASTVVVVAAAFILVFVSKGTALFGIVNTGIASSFSQAGTSSVSKVNINKH